MNELVENFFRAYRRGYEARAGAKNPYHTGSYLDGRGAHWSKFWKEGHEDAAAGKPMRYVPRKRRRAA